MFGLQRHVLQPNPMDKNNDQDPFAKVFLPQTYFFTLLPNMQKDKPSLES